MWSEHAALEWARIYRQKRLQEACIWRLLRKPRRPRRLSWYGRPGLIAFVISLVGA